MNNNALYIIIAIIISIIAQATNTNLVSNTTFILLLFIQFTPSIIRANIWIFLQKTSNKTLNYADK